MSRAVPLALAGVALLAGAYALAAVAASAWSAPTAVEEAMRADGNEVARATASPLPALRAGGHDVVMILGAKPLLDAERAALADHVRAGGEVWIVGPDPSLADLEGDPATRARAYAGRLHDESGAAARVAVGGAQPVAVTGALALDLLESAFEPLAVAGTDAFRDSDGDGRLSRGEPAGPFVVAAAAPLGDGRVVVVGADDPERVAPLLGALPGAGQRVLVLDQHRLGAWSAPALGLLRVLATVRASVLAGTVAVAAGLAALALVLQQPPTPREEAHRRARELVERHLARQKAAAPPSPPPSR